MGAGASTSRGAGSSAGGKREASGSRGEGEEGKEVESVSFHCKVSFVRRFHSSLCLLHCTLYLLSL